MLKLIATTVLVLSACIGDGVDRAPDSLPVDETNEIDPGTEPTIPDPYVGDFEVDDDVSVCDLLPDGDDACAHACDPDGLAS